MKYKILFFGSSNFSIKIFELLFNLDFVEIVGVVTQEAKAVGRKKEIRSSLLKKFILERYSSIKVFEPENLTASLEVILKQTSPDYIFIASYGKIIPAKYFDHYKFLNLHCSLLPILRGAVPMQMAIIKGMTTTGVTLQSMKPKMDVGDIISQKEIENSEIEDFYSLEQKCILRSKEIIEQDLERFFKGEITPLKQDEAKASYCYIRDLQNIQIDWNRKAVEIDRMLRGVCYEGITVPIFEFSGFRVFKLKIFKTNLKDLPELPNIKTGEVVTKDKRLFVKAKDQFIEILELQASGKKRMSARDFMNGLRL